MNGGTAIVGLALLLAAASQAPPVQDAAIAGAGVPLPVLSAGVNRFTQESGETTYPLWAADHIIFTSMCSGAANLWRRRADGGGTAERLTTGPRQQNATAISPDGKRGGGLACWLELMRILRQAKPVRDVVFVASSGHDLGHLGVNAFVDRRRGIVSTSVAWIHLGANIGAARNAIRRLRAADATPTTSPSASLPQAGGNTVQASDDQIERMLAQAMTSTNLTIDVRLPRNRVPGGEAEVVHRGGGRDVSVIGSSDMFHNPPDRDPDVIDARAIGAFVEAFGSVAKTLAGRDPFRV